MQGLFGQTITELTPADAKIEKEFRKAKTPPLSSYRHFADEIERELDHCGVRRVAVDEAKRALFHHTTLKAFHFVVYPAAGDNWLLFCRRRGPSAEDRQMMQEWQQIFGDGFKAVFAVERAHGIVYLDSLDERLRLDDCRP
jgi:hypothetical protein